MSRSKWKFPLVSSLPLVNNFLIVKSRDLIITPFYLNKEVRIYNGKLYNNLLVSEEMLHHKFGEFSPTKKKFTFKKKSKKQ